MSVPRRAHRHIHMTQDGLICLDDMPVPFSVSMLLEPKQECLARSKTLMQFPYHAFQGGDT